MMPKTVVRFTIFYSLFFLYHAAKLAADGAAPSVTATKTANGQAAPPTGNEQSTFPLHGTVVDEKGAPVPNVKVFTSAVHEQDADPAALTDAAGNFTLRLPSWQVYALLLAKEEAGGRIGVLQYVPGKARPPARIVLRTARAVAVTVVDAKERPISGAKVGVAFESRNGLIVVDYARQKLTRALTDAKGQAVLRVPSDMPLACVWTVKAGAGFDYILYRTRNDRRQNQKQQQADSERRAPDDRRPIKFVLGGVHKMRVHLVDERRRPLAGVRVRAAYFQRPGRGGAATFSVVEEFVVAADRTGMVEFDAIPAEALPPLVFESGTRGYFIYEPATFDPAEPVTDLTVVATRLPVLRVQVTYPDGRPALGAQIRYTARLYGSGGSASIGNHWNDSAGESEIHAFHSDAYCVVSATSSGFASSMAARVARMGEPLRPVHLVLQPAARVHGTLTVGKDRRPAANEPIALIQRDEENYSKLPEDERLPRTLPLAQLAHVAIDIPFHATTDEQGRFEFDAAPGRYVIGAGRVPLNKLVKATDLKDLFPGGANEFEIKDQKEITVDLHCDVPPSARKRPPRSSSATGAKAGS